MTEQEIKRHNTLVDEFQNICAREIIGANAALEVGDLPSEARASMEGRRSIAKNIAEAAEALRLPPPTVDELVGEQQQAMSAANNLAKEMRELLNAGEENPDGSLYMLAGADDWQRIRDTLTEYDRERARAIKREPSEAMIEAVAEYTARTARTLSHRDTLPWDQMTNREKALFREGATAICRNVMHKEKVT